MLLAAEWGTDQVFWSMLWFFVFLGWFLLTIRVLWNILRSSTLGGVAKAIWLAAVLLFPFLGVFAYLAYSGDLADPVRDEQYQNIVQTGAYPYPYR
jgi:hypothetical protein